jgi:hypothetical protein
MLTREEATPLTHRPIERIIDLVTKGTNLRDKIASGTDAERASAQPDQGAETNPMPETVSQDPLAPAPGEETADALLIYSRERYLAARRGEIPREDFAADLVRHVRTQAPRRVLRAAAAAIRNA